MGSDSSPSTMIQKLYGKKAAALYRLATTRRLRASTTRRLRIPTTRPTTGPLMTIGAALVTSGTTSTPATGKRPTNAVCRRWRGDVGGGAAAASVAALLRNTYHCWCCALSSQGQAALGLHP